MTSRLLLETSEKVIKIINIQVIVDVSKKLGKPATSPALPPAALSGGHSHQN